MKKNDLRYEKNRLFVVDRPTPMCLNQPQKPLLIPPVILLGPLRRPFHMVLSAPHAGLLGQVALHQQLVDILVCVLLPALVDGVGALAQRHGRHAVVLGHHDIPLGAQVHQCKVHRVRAGAHEPHLAVIGPQDVVGVAEQDHRYFVLPEMCIRDRVKYMLPPTIVCCALMMGVFMLLFGKEMRGITLETVEQEAAGGPLTGRQKAALGIILATVLLWMTNSVHGINNTLITVVATLLLFGIGILHREDLKTIDVTTLIFLTAAFAIGGVMKACGAADKVFGVLAGIFPAEFSAVYLLLMVAVSMALHMILGSNTTTLSVVVPGMMILCGDAVSSPVIVFAAIISVSFHAILPFHSVSMMIGASNGYFPSRYVTRMGIPATVLVYALAAGVFLPYWKMIGLL